MRRLPWLLPPAALLLPAALAACGDLPQPFRGEPGATARRLSQPPPARLVIATPADALLPDDAARQLAGDLATALQGSEVPAVANRAAAAADWRVETTAAQRDGRVVPGFRVLDNTGKDQGHAEGGGVALSEWSNARPALLESVANDAAPKLIDLLRGIQAARMQSDPNSLYNRPAKVFVADVAGAPGDGDVSLTKQMRAELEKRGEVVQTTASGADFGVVGRVNAVPIAGGMLRIEIQWRMNDAAGHDLGMVLQLNEVQPATVQGYWGDVALAVAKEAAGGVRETILRNSGHTPEPQATDTPVKPAATPATAAPTPIATTP